MTAGRAFALLFVLAFYCVGFVDHDSPLYYAAGFLLLAGFALIVHGILHPTRR